MTANNDYSWGLSSAHSAADAALAGLGAVAPVFEFDQYYFNRERLDHFMDHIREPVLVAGGSVSEPQVVHLFDSHEAFDVWARSTRFAAQFEHISDIVTRTRARRDVVLPEEPWNRELDVLLGNAPIDRQWAGLHVKTAVADASASLFEEKNFGGRLLETGPCAIDDLGDIDFYRSITSIKVRGVCLLTDLKLFGGTRIYFTGDPLVEIPNLGTWGFSKRAASAIVV